MRVPVWGWVVGGVIGVGAVGNALEPEGQPAGTVTGAVVERPYSTELSPAANSAPEPAAPVSNLAPAEAATTTEPPTTTVAPTTTTATTTASTTTTTTTTTVAPTTTAAPTTTRPATTAVTSTTLGIQTLIPAGACDPNYEGACVPVASDVDCAGGSGNGPEYVSGPVYVVGSDIYDLDRDGDGTGCDG